MQSAVLRALEFDRIREVLASRALTPLGRERAARLEPCSERSDVERSLALTTAAVAFARDGGTLAISAPEEILSILGLLHVADQPLEPLALRGLARLLDSTGAVGAAARRSGDEGLTAIGLQVATFDDETAAVERAIEPTGDISDRASGALRDIRESLRRQRAKLRTSLDALARGRETAKYLQDQIVTDRNGRYVLVVRAEHREAIPGIVHGSSASGASLYLEPLATVSLNNDVVALVERERAEIQRILAALTQAFRDRLDDVEATADAASVFDELYARVDLARRTDGVAPGLSADGRLEFRGARHPLLIPAIRELTSMDQDGERPKHPVASDLVVLPPARALVISGPNTGGKTVALKAFGLLALMAQSGLLIPVEPGSTFTPFRSVFADIGDEQSIATSLSTFSAHIANIVAMERALVCPALVLLDEVGSGTDPTEGGALGAAIVDHFKTRGALVIATTHDDALKSYAATTDGVLTAGFGFNPDTFAPSYRLRYGSPGRSLALEIARRLGMPEDVIADAHRRRTGRESLLAAHLARVDDEIARLTHERDALAAAEQAVAAERQRLLDRESRLAEREAVLKRRLDDKLNEKMREARAEIDRVVGTLKQKAEALAQRAETRGERGGSISTGDMGALRSEARAAVDRAGGAAGVDGADAGGPEPLAAPPAIGDVVFVPSLNAQGIIRGLSGQQAEVDARGIRLKVRVKDLRAPLTRAAAGHDRPRDTGRVKVDTADRSGGPTKDLLVVGSTVDDAIDRVSKFLDDALLSDERRLRVVHGHGTGRLREGLVKFLRQHPLVASVAPAPDREGGQGATIVELKD